MAPPEVVLTEVSVEHVEQGWTVNLNGTVTGDLRHGARVLAEFEEQLSIVPWRIDITDSFRDSWMEQFNQGLSSDGAKLGFAIAGVMP